jgi:hypothetical protein
MGNASPHRKGAPTVDPPASTNSRPVAAACSSASKPTAPSSTPMGATL